MPSAEELLQQATINLAEAQRQLGLALTESPHLSLPEDQKALLLVKQVGRRLQKYALPSEEYQISPKDI